MIYFKAKKNFPFGTNIPVIIEISESSYNFITHEWSLQTEYFLTEEDLITNKMRLEVSKYIINNGEKLSEDTIANLISNYIEKADISPVYTKTIKLFFYPKEDENPMVFNNIEPLKVFLLQTIQSNPTLIEVIPESLVLYNEAILKNRVKENLDKIVEM